MIQEIEITNFKAIGETIRIPIRPITLFFGANSCGKSSILQCLMLISQIQNGDSMVDVGIFRDFIYQHDTNKEFCIKFNCQLHKDTIINTLAVDDPFYEDDPLGDIGNCFKQSLEGYDNYSLAYYFKGDPRVRYERIEMFLGSEEKPAITYYPDRRTHWDRQFSSEVEYNYDHSYSLKYFDIFQKYIVNICMVELSCATSQLHPFNLSEEAKSRISLFIKNFKKEDDITDLIHAFFLKNQDSIRARKNYVKSAAQSELYLYGDPDKYTTYLEKRYRNQSDPKIILLKLYEDILNDREICFQGDMLTPNKIGDQDFRDLLQTNFDAFEDKYEDLMHLSNPLLLIPVLSQNIKLFVSRFDHIGPLREMPERYYLPGHKGDNGAKALAKNTDLLRRVNEEFLNLQTGYKLEIIKLCNPDVEVDNVFLLQFIDQQNATKATIKDVGFGFSQVLPIVVKSRAEFYKIILIEQPELHLHPAMQAELGDLFIRGVKSVEEVGNPINFKGHFHQPTMENDNSFMLETHSEHLILRLLRRVRETTEGELPENIPPIKPEDIAVLHMQPGKNGAVLTHIPITEDGEFAHPWPQGFFPERAKELF